MDQARALIGVESQSVQHAVQVALDSSAALDRQSGRLVQSDDVGVLEQDPIPQVRRLAFRHRLVHAPGAVRNIRQGGHPNFLAGL